MARRKYTPLHNFWHPRVEGQIKHTMGRHPQWFNFPPKTSAKMDCIGSLAKRIVGEIVAVTSNGNNIGLHNGSDCTNQLSGADAANVSRRRVRRNKVVAVPLNLHWYDFKKTKPAKGGQTPYLVAYRAGSGKTRVTTAVWAGIEKQWIFLVPKFKSGLPENVQFWAKYPEPPTKTRVDNE